MSADLVKREKSIYIDESAIWTSKAEMFCQMCMNIMEKRYVSTVLQSGKLLCKNEGHALCCI